MTLNGEMAPFYVILPNLVVSVHCVKVVDKAITMDNLLLLCLVVNVCTGTARRPRYKFINSRSNAAVLAYRFDIGSRI